MKSYPNKIKKYEEGKGSEISSSQIVFLKKLQLCFLGRKKSPFSKKKNYEVFVSSSRSLDTMGAAAWIDLEARSPVPVPWSDMGGVHCQKVSRGMVGRSKKH